MYTAHLKQFHWFVYCVLGPPYHSLWLKTLVIRRIITGSLQRFRKLSNRSVCDNDLWNRLTCATSCLSVPHRQFINGLNFAAFTRSATAGNPSFINCWPISVARFRINDTIALKPSSHSANRFKLRRVRLISRSMEWRIPGCMIARGKRWGNTI